MRVSFIKNPVSWEITMIAAVTVSSVQDNIPELPPNLKMGGIRAKRNSLIGYILNPSKYGETFENVKIRPDAGRMNA